MIGGAGSIPTSDNMFHVTSTYIEWMTHTKQDSEKNFITQRNARTKRLQ